VFRASGVCTTCFARFPAAQGLHEYVVTVILAFGALVVEETAPRGLDGAS
jgi:hypothetical protein